MPLERFDFASDEKRTKKTAREMLRMVQEINRRVHELPYRELRARYFGRAAYDFGEVTLNVVGGRLTRARRFDDALVFLRLNDELFPRSAAVQVAMGDAHLARGDTTAAAGAYRTALERDPNDGPARQRLRRLGRQ